MIAALLLIASNPFAGEWGGVYRAGFVNPKPIAVSIAEDGTTQMDASGVVRIGETDPFGNFDVRARGVRWVGSFRWEGETLVGTFQTEHPAVRGTMWLTRS